MIVRNAVDCPERWKRLLKGKKIGVLTHAPAVTMNFERSLDLLSRELEVVAAWGPEHGLNGVAQAGITVNSETDRRTGIPIHSLYGKKTAPDDEELKAVDAVVCDFCDIGSRFYTYIYTMSDTMTACAKAGVPFFVLDRINPIGGIRTEGFLLRKGFESGVGRFPIPVRHGLTIGEIAQVFNGKFGIGCQLTVIPMDGWTRQMEFEDLNIPWINPSPNMPSADCARIYNGTCFLEGTNFSEGRGTTRPYELIGAPFADPFRLADRLNRYHFKGLTARPCFFEPTFSKHVKTPCGGIQWMISDRKNAAFFEAGIRLLDILRSDYPEMQFTANLDSLMGSNEFRLGKSTADELIQRGEEESRKFKEDIKAFYLYPNS